MIKMLKSNKEDKELILLKQENEELRSQMDSKKISRKDFDLSLKNQEINSIRNSVNEE